MRHLSPPSTVISGEVGVSRSLAQRGIQRSLLCLLGPARAGPLSRTALPRRGRWPMATGADEQRHLDSRKGHSSYRIPRVSGVRSFRTKPSGGSGMATPPTRIREGYQPLPRRPAEPSEKRGYQPTQPASPQALAKPPRGGSNISATGDSSKEVALPVRSPIDCLCGHEWCSPGGSPFHVDLRPDRRRFNPCAPSDRVGLASGDPVPAGEETWRGRGRRVTSRPHASGDRAVRPHGAAAEE